MSTTFRWKSELVMTVKATPPLPLYKALVASSTALSCQNTHTLFVLTQPTSLSVHELVLRYISSHSKKKRNEEKTF